MKHTTKLIAISLVAVFMFAGASAPTMAASVQLPPIEYTEGLEILVYYGNAFEPESEGFANNWNIANNTVTLAVEYDFAANIASSSFDALYLPRTNDLNAANVSAIATWFAQGDKYLFIGGESDFSDFYDSNDVANPLLAELGTSLRLFSGSVEDPASNDAAAYRLVANTTGVSSPLTDYVTDGFEQAVFHGPTAIAYAQNSTHWGDLRTASLSGALSNVSIVLNTSSSAIALDSSTSLNVDTSDIYAYLNNTEAGINGSYPMLATDLVGSSMVVVAGESIFTDYKFMYGAVTENNKEWHNGSVIVDRLQTYFFSVLNDMPTNTYQLPVAPIDIITETETEIVTETAFLNSTLTEVVEGEAPVNTLGVLFGLTTAMVAVYSYRRKN